MRRPHAGWIFERLGLDVALAGDLIEECAAGRSVFWYWRQVLAAVWVGIWGDIYDHKVLVLRAIATGSAVNAVWLYLWGRFLHIGLTRTASLDSFVSLLVILLTQTVTGWIVARTHRAHAIPMVCAFAIWLLIWALGSFDATFSKMLIVDSLDQPRFRPYLARYLAWSFVPIVIEIAGLLAGGTLAARANRQPSQPAQN
jgi:hypothetical protein